MEGTILNQDLLEHDIKKVIIDSFLKGRNEIVKDCKMILENTSCFKDQLILSHLIDNYLNCHSIEIKELYQQLCDTCLCEKVRTALERIREIYLTNSETLESINEGTFDKVNILSEKDLMDIRDSYLSVIKTLEEMIAELKEKFAL